MICGTETADIRIPHKGDVTGRVIEGAYTVLDEFDRVNGKIDRMKALPLSDGEQRAFARAALALRYEDVDRAPVTEDQLLRPRRFDDRASNLWVTLNRVQLC